MKDFLKNESGQALTEYVIITALITLMALGFYKAISIAYNKALEKIIDGIAKLNLVEGIF